MRCLQYHVQPKVVVQGLGFQKHRTRLDCPSVLRNKASDINGLVAPVLLFLAKPHKVLERQEVHRVRTAGADEKDPGRILEMKCLLFLWPLSVGTPIAWLVGYMIDVPAASQA